MRFTLLLLATSAFAQPGATALDRYVAKPDAAYQWKLVKSASFPTGTSYVLEMTSQEWLTEKEVNRTTWKHWLTIVRPKEVKSKTGFLFISGGSNTNPNPPGSADLGLVEAAVTTNTVVAELRMVPNQPLTFVGDTAGTEDHLITWTWLQYLKTGDDKWPMRQPMTKAAVRAMDTVTAFCKSADGGGIDVEKFVVAGGSKRGWTAWTTAAVDALNAKRVAAVVPFVIDVLNIVPSMEHHWRAYGFWAPAVGDYVKRGLMDWSNTPQYKNLMKIEEPFEYRDRLTLPKYIVNAAGDQFFLPDSSQFYWDKLKGEKYLRYVPNTDHSMRNSDALQAAVAFYDAVAKGAKPPQYTWKMEKNGNIVVTPQGKPSSVKLWQANNPKARDFRLMTIGPAYQATELKPDGKGRYVGTPQKPSEGWSAYFVEVTWPSQVKYPFKFTSPVRVWPEKYPFPPYQPKPVK
jgi:PhoPQ-activated pathogenicity-related protein